MTDLLNITDVSPSQSQKEVTINEALNALANAGNQFINIPVDNSGSVAIQSIDTGTVATSFVFERNMVFRLTDDTTPPAAAFDVEVPALTRLFIVDNTTAFEATVEVDPDSDGPDGATASVPAGEARLLFSDGTNILSVAGSSSGGGGSIEIFQAGASVVAAATGINFVSGATVVDNSGVADVTVSGGGGGGSASSSNAGRFTKSASQSTTGGAFTTITWDGTEGDAAGALDTTNNWIEVTADLVGKPLILIAATEFFNSNRNDIRVQKSTDGGTNFDNLAFGSYEDGSQTYIEPNPQLGDVYRMDVRTDSNDNLQPNLSYFSYASIGAGAPTVTYAEVSLASNQVTAVDGEEIDWDVEDADTGSYFDPGTTGRLTVPSGVSLVSLTANVQFSGTGGSVRGIRILKNGTEVVGRMFISETNNRTLNVHSGPVPVVAGDFFTVTMDRGGTTVTVNSADETFFKILKLA